MPAWGTPVLSAAIPTGLDPVSVRWRTAVELWVVNHTSDSVSVVDASRCVVKHTLQTADEPADVVFAGTPQRAWVSCSQVNTIQLFDPANPAGGGQTEVTLEGEDPRALAVSADGTKRQQQHHSRGKRLLVNTWSDKREAKRFRPSQSSPRAIRGGPLPGSAFRRPAGHHRAYPEPERSARQKRCARWLVRR